MSRRKAAGTPAGMWILDGLPAPRRPICRTDGCNHGDCEEAAKQAAQMDAAAERHDHYVHDAYDREGDR